MRKKLIIICLAVLAASLAAGCGNGDNDGPGGPGAISREQAEKGLEMMHFENAPTLGPIAKKAQLAMMIREWGELWDVMSDKLHNSYEKKFNQGEKGIDTQIEGMQTSLATQNEAGKKSTQDYIDKLKKIKAQFPSVHNGKEYFILWINTMMAPSSTEAKPPAQTTGQHVEQDMIVVSGEDFSPDHKTGWIKIKTVKSNIESKWYPFVNEGGQWKLAIDLGGGASGE